MCFSLPWFEQVLIYIVVLGGVIAILRLIVPWALGLFGWPAGGIEPSTTLSGKLAMMLRNIWSRFPALSI